MRLPVCVGSARFAIRRRYRVAKYSITPSLTWKLFAVQEATIVRNLILDSENIALVCVQEHMEADYAATSPEKELDLLRSMAEALSWPVILLPVARKQAAEAIASSERRTLLVCGGYLEGAVTRAVLGALLDGYDVFIVEDAVSSLEPEKANTFLSRIRDCGGCVVTTRQTILELLSTGGTEQTCEVLRAFLKSCHS